MSITPVAGDETMTVTTPTEREVRIERVFGAGPERLWTAFTQPDEVARWWGRGNPLDVVRLEVEPGGHWRVEEHADGLVHGFEGRYAEVDPPRRIVRTFEYDGAPGHPMIETTEFEALPDGTTRVTVTAGFYQPAERDAMVGAGMTTGLAQSFAALDALLAAG